MNVFEILNKRYPSAEYALMEEVSDASGHQRSRSADWIVVGLWPSRGHRIEGIEQKASRSDWLRELKMPEKAENIFKYCDRWWLLTTDDSIAKIEEIPETWGWLSIKGEKIYVKKEAPPLTPVSLTKSFIACMLKRASDRSKYVRYDTIEDRIKASYKKGEEASKNMIEHLRTQSNDYQKSIREFEEASGIHINRFQKNIEMGKAVKFLADGGADGQLKKLQDLEARAKQISETITNAIQSLSSEQLANGHT